MSLFSDSTCVIGWATWVLRLAGSISSFQSQKQSENSSFPFLSSHPKTQEYLIGLVFLKSKTSVLGSEGELGLKIGGSQWLS